MNVKCPFCGSEYERKLADKACRGCPLSKTCGRVKCPYCGEEFQLPSTSVNLLRKIGAKNR